MPRRVVRVVSAVGAALVLCFGCSGQAREPGTGRRADVGHDAKLPSANPSTSVVGGDKAGTGHPAYVTYSESTNRLSFLTRDLKVLGWQTQLRTPLSDLAALGRNVAVGYTDGRISLIKASSGAMLKLGHVDTAALGRAAHGPNTLLLDQLFSSPSSLLVVGRFARVGEQNFSGFVQELDPHTLTATKTYVFAAVPLDLHVDANGHALCLLSNGSVVDLSDNARVRWRRPEKPTFFLPLSKSQVATVSTEPVSTLWLPDGRRVPLGAESAPMGLVNLGRAGYAVLLEGKGVLRTDPTGGQTLLPISDQPYAQVFDGRRLLVAQAHGDKLLAIGLSPFEVTQSVTLDWGVDRVVMLAASETAS